MKNAREEPPAAADGNETFAHPSRETLSRREFLAGAAAFGVTIALPGEFAAAADGKKTFTILHTNDMQSFIGMGPGSDYSPFSLDDDTTRRDTRGWPA